MKLKKLLLEIDKNPGKLSRLCPLTKGEVEHLRDEFLIEFTYNSNAIEGNTLTLQEIAMVLEGVTIDQKPLKEHSFSCSYGQSRRSRCVPSHFSAYYGSASRATTAIFGRAYECAMS